MAKPVEFKSSFPAITNANTRVLIVGSLPGERSLERGEYYANPRNQFWRLMEEVTGHELVAVPYAKRLNTLLSAGVGLWDVVASGERAGSLDSRIRSDAPNAVGQFAATLASLRAIGFNGGKAASIGRKQLAENAGYALVTLPSSSTANTATFERKRAEWLQLRRFLHSRI